MTTFPAIKKRRLEIFSSIGCSSAIGNFDGDKHGNERGQKAEDREKPDEADQREEAIAAIAPEPGKLANDDDQRHQNENREQQNNDAPANPGFRLNDDVGHKFHL